MSRKVLFSVTFSLAALSIAHAETLECEVKVNTELSSRQSLKLTSGEAKAFGKLKDYAFKLNNKGDGRFELEVFDPSAPSRSYAEAKLRDAGDEVRWTLWSREILLEAACSKAD